jgi:hypothetical protein
VHVFADSFQGMVCVEYPDHILFLRSLHCPFSNNWVRVNRSGWLRFFWALCENIGSSGEQYEGEREVLHGKTQCMHNISHKALVSIG